MASNARWIGGSLLAGILVASNPGTQQWWLDGQPASLVGTSATIASATAASATWTVPAAAGTVGAVTSSATAALTTWTVPDALATIEGQAQETAATAALTTWAVPAASTTAGGLIVAATGVSASWSVPAAVAGIVVPATAISTQWTVPAALAVLATPAMAATATWTVQSADATPQAISTAATAALANWEVPEAVADGPGQAKTRAATAAITTWIVPEAYALQTWPQRDVTVGSTASAATWVVVSASASGPGQAQMVEAGTAAANWTVPSALADGPGQAKTVAATSAGTTWLVSNATAARKTIAASTHWVVQSAAATGPGQAQTTGATAAMAPWTVPNAGTDRSAAAVGMVWEVPNAVAGFTIYCIGVLEPLAVATVTTSPIAPPSEAGPAYCIGVLEPLSAAPWGAGAGTFPALTGAGSDTAPGVECSVEGLTSIWNDDFESGNPITTSYTNDGSSTAAGIGVGGSWGVDSNTAYGAFIREVGIQEGTDSGFAAEITNDRDLHTAYGYYAIEIRAGLAQFLSLYQGGYDPTGNDLQDDETALTVYYSTGLSTEAAAVTGVLTSHTFQTIRLIGKFSTWKMPEDEPNPDGWIDVCVDGIRVIHATGVQFCTPHGWANYGANEWDRVVFGPMGHGDNVHIWAE